MWRASSLFYLLIRYPPTRRTGYTADLGFTRHLLPIKPHLCSCYFKLANISKNTTKTQTPKHSCVRGMLGPFFPPCYLSIFSIYAAKSSGKAMHSSHSWDSPLETGLPSPHTSHGPLRSFLQRSLIPTQIQHTHAPPHHVYLGQLCKQPSAKYWNCKYRVGTWCLHEPQPVSLHGLLHGTGNSP